MIIIQFVADRIAKFNLHSVENHLFALFGHFLLKLCHKSPNMLKDLLSFCFIILRIFIQLTGTRVCIRKVTCSIQRRSLIYTY